MLENIKERMNSDAGASISTEWILFFALAVFTVLMISRYIITPLIDTSKGIGEEVKKMNPN